MTRKRFVKLLMARGCGRNQAKELANMTYDYAKAYEQIKSWEAKYWN